MLGLGNTIVSSSPITGVELNWMRIHYNNSQAGDTQQALRMTSFSNNGNPGDYPLAVGDTIRVTAQVYLDPTQHVSGDGWNGTDNVELNWYFGGPYTALSIPQSTVYDVDITHTVNTGTHIVKHYLYIPTSTSLGDRPLEGARFYIRDLRVRTVDADGTGDTILDHQMNFSASGSENGIGGSPLSCYACAGGSGAITRTLGTSPLS